VSVSLSIGNAKIAGMAADLKLTSNQYSIALVVFFGILSPVPVLLSQIN